MTQKLFEACSAQADYRIPQAAQKGSEVPKTTNGEDLGVGEGWWYTRKLLYFPFSYVAQNLFLDWREEKLFSFLFFFVARETI
jgi:cytochrome b pre-mRNA-processing protein 3